MQEQTQSRSPGDESSSTPASARGVVDDLRAYARQHANLARKNYGEFTKRYGHPLDPVKHAARDLNAKFQEFWREADAGWKKLEHDIEERTQANEPATVATTDANPSNNGRHTPSM
ncbi:MAG: hypothetical protein ACYDDF_00825 [Thermoplasmatota archaeon]